MYVYVYVYAHSHRELFFSSFFVLIFLKLKNVNPFNKLKKRSKMYIFYTLRY